MSVDLWRGCVSAIINQLVYSVCAKLCMFMLLNLPTEARLNCFISVGVYNKKVIESVLGNIRHSFIWRRRTRKLVRPSPYGAPVAQWVKRWPTDLAVPSSIPARGEIFSTVNGVPLHTAFHYHLPIVLI